ncbi:hypothetical protein [Denitrobacterium detoxificans]|uniref:hypothetical protein n=1 Tax=Denitrobacterium detoxificans TaxID=79604 RepID=UPI0026ED9C6F|nr:hypothetical protein [Denitrobacterium detoxificans]MBE6465868.1 hypothetical protein [Denitrobacterium detoxificans]
MSSFDSTGGDLSRMCSDTGIVLDVDQDRSLVWIKTVEGTHSSYPDTVLLLDYSSRKGIYPVQLDDGLVAGSKVVVGYFPIEMESGGYSGTSLLRDESD